LGGASTEEEGGVRAQKDRECDDDSKQASGNRQNGCVTDRFESPNDAFPCSSLAFTRTFFAFFAIVSFISLWWLVCIFHFCTIVLPFPS
jgi:hypothetical protein